MWEQYTVGIDQVDKFHASDPNWKTNDVFLWFANKKQKRKDVKEDGISIQWSTTSTWGEGVYFSEKPHY